MRLRKREDGSRGIPSERRNLVMRMSPARMGGGEREARASGWLQAVSRVHDMAGHVAAVQR